MTTRLTRSGRRRAGFYKEITWERERELLKYLGEGEGGGAARWWALERLAWRGQAPRNGQQVRAGARAGGGRARPLMWAGAWCEGPRQARACMRRCEGVAYLIGALKRNLKQSECFPIMVGLPVSRACMLRSGHAFRLKSMKKKKC